jgi:hypothetical protein
MTFQMRGLFAGAAMLATLGMTAAARADVTISTDATANMSCTSGVCTPTAKKAVLNVSDLTTMLSSGNVVVNTGMGLLAKQVKDIVVAAGFNWASASSLTLDAYDSVTVNQPVAVNGSGAVVLTTDDGGTKGALSFGKKGGISFLSTSNSVTINGATYTLVNSVAALAHDIAVNPAGAYALASNYDASQDGIYGTAPIPTTLTGTVQGLGNTISHLTIRDHTKEDQIGLFKTVGPSGTIANLRLANVDFAGLNKSIKGGGGLAYINEGLLFGDQVSSKFGGRNGCCFWGGLVAVNEGNVVQSSADVKINSPEGAGGLVGTNYSGTISFSRASGSIVGSGLVGGLVGISRADIDESFATTSVTGGDQASAGGLTGENEGSIENSYATGVVSGGANSLVGGLDGDAEGGGDTFTTSYSTGAVSGGNGSLVGGLLGVEGLEVSDCYWDTTTSGTGNGTGQGNVDGITGLTTQQLQSGLPKGFHPTIWAESPKINGGLPYLVNNPPPNN